MKLLVLGGSGFVSRYVCKEALVNAAHDDGYLYFCQRVYDLSALREAGLPVPQTPLRQGLEEQIAYILGGRKLPE